LTKREKRNEKEGKSFSASTSINRKKRKKEKTRKKKEGTGQGPEAKGLVIFYQGRGRGKSPAMGLKTTLRLLKKRGKEKREEREKAGTKHTIGQSSFQFPRKEKEGKRRVPNGNLGLGFPRGKEGGEGKRGGERALAFSSYWEKRGKRGEEGDKTGGLPL